MLRFRVSSIITMVLLLGCSPAATISSRPATSTPPPSAGAAAIVGAYFEAFNSGDPNKMLAFRRDHWSHRVPWLADPWLVGEYDVKRALAGTLTPRSIQPDPEGLDALARTADGDWFRVHFSFEAEPPHKIVEGRMRCVAAPPDEGGGPRNDAELVQAARAFAARLTQKEVFSGVVLIARNGVPLLLEAFGPADREHGIANRLDTKFNLGSMNKMFTAIAIAQLVNAGKLAYADTVSQVLPGELPETLGSITVDELLTHTAGLGDAFEQRYFANRSAFRTPRDFIQVFGNDPPAARGQWRYSNFGYIVLGRIIERVSGTTYDDFVRTHIFEPAKMTDTGAFDADADVPHRALPYTPFRDQEPPRAAARNVAHLLPMKGTPAGGGYSTAPDLLRFAQAFTADKIVPAATRKLLTTGNVTMSEAHPNERYGYGMIVRTTNGLLHVGHGGTWPGINAIFEIVPDRGYAIVVLANHEMPAADRVATRILSWIAGM